jgi:hypothetical protein
MEEKLSSVLLEAGEYLADRLSLGLAERGLPSELSVFLDGHRVVVASHSAALRKAEVGRAGCPPKAIMEGLARDGVPQVLQTLVERLGSVRL